LGSFTPLAIVDPLSRCLLVKKPVLHAGPRDPKDAKECDPERGNEQQSENDNRQNEQCKRGKKYTILRQPSIMAICPGRAGLRMDRRTA